MNSIILHNIVTYILLHMRHFIVRPKGASAPCLLHVARGSWLGARGSGHGARGSGHVAVYAGGLLSSLVNVNTMHNVYIGCSWVHSFLTCAGVATRAVLYCVVEVLF